MKDNQKGAAAVLILASLAAIYYFLKDRFKATVGELPYNDYTGDVGIFYGSEEYGPPLLQTVGTSLGNELFGPAYIPPAPLLQVRPKMTLDDIYRRYADRYGLDWRLLKALATIESSENPGAKNPADPSYGLMQVLCTTANADPNSRCTNKFNVIGWDSATPNALYDPDYNVSIASQILKWNLDTYGTLKGIAVYNNWSARNAPANGPFPNQGYVDKVVAAFRNFGGAI